MSNKTSISSRSRPSLKSDLASISIFQEEIPDLLFSRRVVYKDVNHLQTLSGHTLDILKSLNELMDKTFQRLDESCQLFAVNPSLICESLFLSVCRYFLFKAENFDETNLNLTNENSIQQTESYDLFRFAYGRYLDLAHNSKQNANNRKTGSPKKYKNKNRDIFDIRNILVKNMSRFMWNYYKNLQFEKWFTITISEIQEYAKNENSKYYPQINLSTLMNERSNNNELQFIYSILLYYSKTCLAVPDRAFLNKINSGFWENECIIHGSSHAKSYFMNKDLKMSSDQS